MIYAQNYGNAVDVYQREIQLECDKEYHVIPTHDHRKHTNTKRCWCMPKLVYRDKDTNNCVWSHNETQ